MLNPFPFLFSRLPGARGLWRKFPIGSVETKVRYGIFDRAHYAYGVYAAADLAKRLGLSAISVIEFGVAGGRGLLALERIAAEIGTAMGITIHVAGFDSGEGMPSPSDYRDLPHVWEKGYYKMDVPKLKAQLSPNTELVLGNIADTVVSWIPKGPIGFVGMDVDYYTSTLDALRLFEGRDPHTYLPRTYCYFDDIIWPEAACHNEYVGQLLAIREFNEAHEHLKLCPIHMLRHMLRSTQPQEIAWHEQMYVLHDFKHPLYCKNVTPKENSHRELPL